MLDAKKNSNTPSTATHKGGFLFNNNVIYISLYGLKNTIF